MESSFAELVHFLAAPFLLCLVLAGIHCYLGLHVLTRGVIFVDLSLAQVSALGAACGVLVGIDIHSPWNYVLALGFTFIASIFLAIARRHEKLFPHEALIGILYAFATACAVLCMDRLPHGSERIKDLLVGQILWVSMADVTRTAAIYVVVGLIHYFYREKFLRLSFGDPTGISAFWDFLFYALFGVVITSSVRLAGVLLVFTFLVVPAFLSAIFFQSIRARLIFGWAIGAVASFSGIALSYLLDLPSGAFVVACCSLIPIGIILSVPLWIKAISKREDLT